MVATFASLPPKARATEALGERHLPLAGSAGLPLAAVRSHSRWLCRRACRLNLALVCKRLYHATRIEGATLWRALPVTFYGRETLLSFQSWRERCICSPAILMLQQREPSHDGEDATEPARWEDVVQAYRCVAPTLTSLMLRFDGCITAGAIATAVLPWLPPAAASPSLLPAAHQQSCQHARCRGGMSGRAGAPFRAHTPVFWCPLPALAGEWLREAEQLQDLALYGHRVVLTDALGMMAQVGPGSGR